MKMQMNAALKGLLLSTTFVGALFANACTEGGLPEGEACEATADCRGELECLVLQGYGYYGSPYGYADEIDGQARCQCPGLYEHDGGDGTCVTFGFCAVGFHDGGDGSCVPDDQCVDDSELNEEGMCRPPHGNQSEECAQYVECQAHYDEMYELSETDLAGSYGPEGSCWMSSPEAADACTAACESAVESLSDALRTGELDPGPCG